MPKDKKRETGLGLKRLLKYSKVIEILRGRRRENRWLVLKRCLRETSQPRAKKVFVMKVKKSFYKN